MGLDYFVVDIETCPIKLQGVLDLDEEEMKKLLNPIDSRIVSIGLRYNGEDFIFHEEDEKEMLVKFWEKWKAIKSEKRDSKVVGFNIKIFDLPFIVARSFIHNVKISSFFLR